MTRPSNKRKRLLNQAPTTPTTDMPESRPSRGHRPSTPVIFGLVAGLLVLLSVLVLLTLPNIYQDGSISSSGTRTFPGLAAIRDTIVPFLFGPHPSSYAATTTPTLAPPSFTLEKYARYKVVRFSLSSPKDQAALAYAASHLFLDFWAITSRYVDVRVRKADVGSVLGFFPDPKNVSYIDLIPDLADAAAATWPGPDRSEPFDPQRLRGPTDSSSANAQYVEETDALFFRDYQPLPVVIQWMRLLQVMFPDLVDTVKVGTSYEGRDIEGLRVGMPPKDPLTGKHYMSDEPRKTIIIQGGVHAREWISTTTVNYVAWTFVTSYGKDTIITKMLHEFDVVFIPVINPDGFEYTWNVDRLWRKNRQQTGMRWCRGFDLDRTFDFQWGPKSDPCSESYGGSEPFEAVESEQLAQWAKAQARDNNVKFVGFVDLHSYAQEVLYPFSYTCGVEPPNLENLEELGIGLAKAIRLTHGEVYGTSAACEGAVASSEGTKTKLADPTRRIEPGGGSAMDWVYHDLGVRFSYQIKLRDTGNYGFLLPKESIVPTGEEIFNAMKYFGDFLLGNNGIERGVDVKENKMTTGELRRRIQD